MQYGATLTFFRINLRFLVIKHHIEAFYKKISVNSLMRDVAHDWGTRYPLMWKSEDRSLLFLQNRQYIT